jgi:hypothetical protein
VGGLLGSAVGSSLQRTLFPGLACEADARWRGEAAARGVVTGPDDWLLGWRDLARRVAGDAWRRHRAGISARAPTFVRSEPASGEGREEGEAVGQMKAETKTRVSQAHGSRVAAYGAAGGARAFDGS